MTTHTFASAKEARSILYALSRSNLRRLLVCFIFLWAMLLASQLSAQSTYNFSTPATLSGASGSYPWNTTATINIGGVSYTLTSGGNGSFSNLSSGGNGNSSALRKDGSGGDSFILKRADGGRFQFYGMWVNHSSMSPYPNTPPFYTLRLTDGSTTVKTYTESTSKNSSITYADDVAVTSVSISFNALLYYVIDDIKVGPAVISLSTVNTTSASNIGGTFATVGGNITSDGGGPITERGVVWSTAQNPTTTGNKVTAGSGSGTFSVQLSNLSKSTTYYARSYAINSAGTAYGNQITFTTTDGSGPIVLPANMDTSFDNYGNYPFEPSCYVGYNPEYGHSQAAIKFTLPELPGTISAAKLRLHINYLSLGANPFLKAWKSNNESWLENTATVPSKDQELGQASATGVGWVEIDITNYVKMQAAGSKVVSLVLTGNTATGASSEVNFNSKENSKDHPQLVITTETALSSNANLSNLLLSSGTLSPVFSSGITSYSASVPSSVSSISVTPTKAEANATIKVNGIDVVSGAGSQAIPLNVGTNQITVAVKAQDGTSKSYTVSITRPASSLPLHALSFNGSNQYVAVPHKPAFDFTTGTVEMWVKPNWTASTKGANPCLISMRSSAGTRYSIHMDDNLRAIGIWNNNSYLTRPYTFTKGQWYHIAAVMTQSSTEFYVNGVSIGSTPNGINSAKTGYELKVGASVTDTNKEYFLGEIDEVRVWNTARTANEILYNYSNPISATNAGLVAYYPIEADVTGPANAVAKKVSDITANAYHGTLFNYYASNANLSNLTLSGATLSPVFAAGTTSYTAFVPYHASSLALTPTVADATATVKVNGTADSNGNAHLVNLNVGANTITVAVTAQDGTQKTYTVTIMRAAASSNADLANLTLSAGNLTPVFAPGTTVYTVTVAPTIEAISITPTVSDATATLTVNGAAATSGALVAVSLDAGSTTSVPVMVTAQNGDVKTYTLNITRPYPPVSAAISSSTNVSCNGGANGSATVVVSGGTGPFTYSWSPAGGSGSTASGLTAGAYTVTVIDANRQRATVNVTITQPAALSMAVTKTNVSCFGGSNGTATASISGGTAPYTYSWSTGGGTGATATGLAAGTYTVTVTDNNGCQITESVDITQPAALSATVSTKKVTTVGGNNGSATVTATGGVEPYTYSWSPRGGTSVTADNLAAGAYTVTVTDANGCSITKAATIAEPTSTNVVAIQRVSASPTNAATVRYHITFNQPVTGLSVSNFGLATSGNLGGSITGITLVNSTTYAVDINTGTGSGDISLSMINDEGLSLDVANLPFPGTENYTIDKDNPVVTGITNNSFYNTDVTITFNEGTALLNGSDFANQSTVIAEGGYTLVVTDQAGNATTLNFTIDKTSPVVTGVAQNGKYNTARTIRFDEGTATLNGLAFASGTVVSEEGEYTLVVTDAAFNSTTVSFEIDTTAPTGSMVINNGASYTNSTAVTLTVTGTGITEMRFNNQGMAPGIWEPLAATKSWNLSSGDGNKVVLAELKDGAGNITQLNASIFYDATLPAVVVSSKVPAVTKAPFEVTVTFSEEVNGFTAAAITIENGTASGFVQISQSEYKATITPATEGMVKVSVGANTAVDLASNGNLASNEVSTVFDVTRPTVALSSKAATHVNAPFAIAFTFSEPVTGFTLADINVTNGSAGDLKRDNGQVYSAVITPATDGEVTVSVAADATLDAATNGNVASAVLSRVYNATQPELTLSTTASTPTNAPFSLSLTFTEEVTGFEVGDVMVTNGTIGDFASINGSEYTALITPAADGEVTVSVPAGKAHDIAANGNKASNVLKLVYDATSPTLVVATTAKNPSNAAFQVTFTFSEAVTGFEAEDVTVENATLSGFSQQSVLGYAATVTPATDGEVKVSVAAKVAEDAAQNGNLASNEISILYDVAKPTVALTTPAAEPTNAPFSLTFTFSEPVTGFAREDIQVVNATASKFTAAGPSVYTALISPISDGEVKVSVAEDVALDAAKNGNSASAILSRTYDATEPTVTLATTAADPVNAPFEVTFSFSEEVFGFEAGDFTVTNGTASGFTKVDGRTYTALVTPAADGDVTIMVAADVAQDVAANGNKASTELRRRYDATAPAGYTLAFNTNRVDVTNVSAIPLSIAGAELGTTYYYTLASSNGGTEVTGTGQVQQESFNLSALDLTDLHDGTLTATLYLVDTAGNKGASVTAEVIKITRDIVAVTLPEAIKVPIRTAYANVPMPAKVEVTYSTGAKEQVSVTWNQGTYNGLVAGAYELTGELILAPMTTNLTQQIAKVTVEVQPNKVPTALAFSTSTFKPEASADEVIGSFTTTDPDDNEFSYTLVAGEGSSGNDLFEMRGDKLYLKSNKGLSGITQLSIRVRSTDPYLNTIEQRFTLSKELYAKPQDQLKIVNAFSPDGDGINDTWIIPELRFYNLVEIEVFDRAGVRLFHTTNPEEGWNGKDANGQVRKGAFFYILQVKDINLVKKGVVTILKK